ncbi:hypothetical protein EG329_007458 [Mollisiaceae sp. DMI_Dod_QoI]|nr:hypothetical protein EG329_007458 [Helotiales sp. DMI_Dod_QoI]
MIWGYVTSIFPLINSIFEPEPSLAMPVPKEERDPPFTDGLKDVYWCPYEVREPGPLPRLSFYGSTSVVYGFPSTGGIWILNPHPVLLQHLSLDRFTDLPTE